MNAVWAARRAGVQRVVRLSAVGAAHDAPTRSGRLHALSDQELEHSGMAWTILRPHWFMQNLLNEAGDIAAEGTFSLNMEQARLGMIDVRDIAAVAARVLTDGPKRHHGRIYTPTGPESLSFDEIAEQLGSTLLVLADAGFRSFGGSSGGFRPGRLRSAAAGRGPWCQRAAAR